MNDGERAKLKRRLQADLDALMDRARRIDAHERETDREVPADSTDRAQYREDDEVVARLDDLTRAEITALRTALSRLEAGAYGTCARCGADIDAARLAAIPTGVTCRACASQDGARGA